MDDEKKTTPEQTENKPDVETEGTPTLGRPLGEWP